MDENVEKPRAAGWKAKLIKHKTKLKIFAGVIATLCLVAVVGLGILYRSITATLPDVNKLSEYDAKQTTKIYSRDGTLIATLFDQNRTPVTIDKVSPFVPKALVAIEDRRFYEHSGVDPWGIARAALGNFGSGEVQQGASTLTMQLARRLFLSDERSYTRKLREAVLAHRMDKTLSKDKILELYLNEVYFGAGAYGVDAAASLYFGKSPDKLVLWQAALLAGLVQAPSAYSPIENKDAALARMSEVLQALLTTGQINQQQVQEAEKLAAAYEFKARPVSQDSGMLKYPYFTSYAIKELSQHFPENYIRRGGLQVYTTLDIPIQQAAETAVTRTILGPGQAMGADSGAVVVLNNMTGQIQAMVGGTEWDVNNQFNRAWQAKRQPGSSFKMFVYAAALEAGYNPEQELADTEAVFNYDSSSPWKPANSDGKFMGAIPIRSGLQFSRNLVAAKVLAHVGPSRVAALAHKMGIDSELPQVASLALGAGEVTPLQMARAYSTLPNGGLLKSNTVLVKVLDADGNLLRNFQEEDVTQDRVISQGTATLMCEMLHRVVLAGTGTEANISDTYIAGKTGTTDSFIDAWFVGFSPHHTVSVWIGRDDNKPMGRVYGGTLPAEIFREVTQVALANEDRGASLPGVKFGEPSVQKLCWDSTYLALPTCPKTYQDSFAAGVVPTRLCPMHRQQKQTIKKIVVDEDSTLLTNVDTNIDEGELTVTVEQSPSLDGDDKDKDKGKVLDVDQDPEVVTASGAIIPYQELRPKNKVKVIKVEMHTPTPYPSPGQTPGESTTVEIISSETPSLDTSESTADKAPLDSTLEETSSEYPEAQSNTESNESTQNEVIYTNQNMDIPADPIKP